MIYKKNWHKWNGYGQRRNYYGYFLFGFIPLYVYRSDWSN